MTLIDLLKGYRKGVDISVRELAERMRVNQYRLQKWEAGKGTPKVDDHKKICEFFKVSSIEEVSDKVLENKILSDKENYTSAGEQELEVPSTDDKETIRLLRENKELQAFKIQTLENRIVELEGELAALKGNTNQNRRSA